MLTLYVQILFLSVTLETSFTHGYTRQRAGVALRPQPPLLRVNCTPTHRYNVCVEITCIELPRKFGFGISPKNGSSLFSPDCPTVIKHEALKWLYEPKAKPYFI